MVDFSIIDQFRPDNRQAEAPEQEALRERVENFMPIEDMERVIIRPLTLALPAPLIALNYLAYCVDRAFGQMQLFFFNKLLARFDEKHKKKYPLIQINPPFGQNSKDARGLAAALSSEEAEGIVPDPSDPRAATRRDVARWIYFFRYPFNKGQAAWWINRSAVERKPGHFIMLGIYEKNPDGTEGELIGEIHIDFDLKRRAFDLGWSVRADRQRGGVVKAAADRAIEQCFAMGFENLLILAGEYNQRSRRHIETYLGLVIRKFFGVKRADGTTRPSIAAFTTEADWYARKGKGEGGRFARQNIEAAPAPV